MSQKEIVRAQFWKESWFWPKLPNDDDNLCILAFQFVNEAFKCVHSPRALRSCNSQFSHYFCAPDSRMAIFIWSALAPVFVCRELWSLISSHYLNRVQSLAYVNCNLHFVIKSAYHAFSTLSMPFPIRPGKYPNIPCRLPHAQGGQVQMTDLPGWPSTDQ